MVPKHPELHFRSWESGDGKLLYNLNADPRVLQWTGDLPFNDLDEAEAFVQNYSHFEQYGFGRWWVFRRRDAACLGWCGLRKGAHGIDFGLRWFYTYWNKGHGIRAGKAVLHWADAQQQGIIYAQHHPENIYSAQLLLSLGFENSPPYLDCHPSWKTYLRPMQKGVLKGK